MKEYYKKYRPQRLEDVVGQTGAIRQLKQLYEDGLPQVLLFTGPSGTGKTTIARILRNMLQCEDVDYNEIDCACVEKPIETVKELRRMIRLSPVCSPCRIWFMEEVQSWSKAGFSQQAMLKLLEDTPKNVYFFLATTNPDKLHKAIRTRATEICLKALRNDTLVNLLGEVIKKEKIKAADGLLEEVAAVSDGSARKALVVLQQVIRLPEKEQLQAVEDVSAEKDLAIKLCRTLINPRCNWPEVAAILREITDEPEAVRRLMLSWARSILLKGGPLAPRAFIVIDVFSAHFYDSLQAGLAAACWEVVNAGK